MASAPKRSSSVLEDDKFNDEEYMSGFKYSHLPPALQDVSSPFGDLVQLLKEKLDSSEMRHDCIKLLFQAKNLAVCAAATKLEVQKEVALKEAIERTKKAVSTS